jgi:hypothetical protein
MLILSQYHIFESYKINIYSVERAGGARPPPFTLSTITSIVVDTPAERTYTVYSPCFSSTPICTLWNVLCSYIGKYIQNSMIKVRCVFQLISFSLQAV